jgi:uncharacterized membrane protein YecN with MAPEG domain
MTTITDEHDPSGAGTARAAVVEGWARVRSHWVQVGAAYLLGVLLALPLAAALALALRQSLEHREAAERMLASWDGLWHRSFAARAEGLSATFDAGVVGIGAVLRSLDALVTGALLDVPLPIAIAGLAYLVGWVLLGGGLLARFGGDPRGVVQLGAIHFRRLFTIAAVGWLAWAIVLGGLLPMLSAWVRAQTRDVIDERIHAAWILGKYAVVWILALAIRLVIDQAKVAAIDDPSRSPWAAVREGLAFCRRRAAAVLGVAVIVGAVGLGLLFAYWLVAPGAAQRNGLQILVAFAIGQLSVIARVVMRAWALASAQALWRASGEITRP